MYKAKEFLYKVFYKCYNEIFKYIKPLKILNTEETITKIQKEKCSVMRFGDGELRMIYEPYSIGFQEYSQSLSKRLLEILNSIEKDNLICIPYTLYKTEHMNQKAAEFWNDLWRFRRKKLISVLEQQRKKRIFGDSLCTRIYMDYNDENKKKSKKLFEKMETIWKEKDIVIVEGKRSRLGVGNDLFSNTRSIRRILAPSTNAFDKYEEILESCKRNCKTSDLVLIALGPTATVLAYDLSKYGLWAIDIGHIDIEYEWMIRNYTEKRKIEGKYVNEVNGEDLDIESRDDEYKKQIIAEI